jgi:Big-like domain-containing protein/calcineurin-like phosphoesterase family protein
MPTKTLRWLTLTLLAAGCLGPPEQAPPAHVTVTPHWVALVPGDSIGLTATAPRAVSWSSDAPAVATVDQRGVVHARAEGLVAITATLDSGSAVAQIVVSPAVLVGAGDIANCSYDDDEATAKVVDAISGVVFTAGDDAYSSGTPQQFTDCYQPTWGRHRPRTRPSPGNHEYNTPGATGYYDYYGTLAGDAGLGYYSYDVGGWHIISLNSNIAMGGGSPQEQWLRADLAAHPAPCTLAYWHHPRFSSGEHGNSTAPQPLWQALYDANADVVINGHDHTYERFAPQTPTGSLDSARGIREFVVGMGGAAFYQFPVVRANSEVRNNTTHGVIKLTLHADGYDWEFVPVAGGTFRDSGSGKCH